MGARPPDLAFVPRSETILPALTRGKFDLMVALDSSDVGRVGVAGAYGLAHSQTVINIDHHPTNTCYGDIHLIVPSAVATTEIVFDLLNYLNLPLNLDIASALLTGLITDTHGFRISATKSRTLEIAQTLMLAGAPLARIMAQTLNRRPYAEVELWKRALPSAQLEGGVISAIITQADIKQAGLRRTGDGGLVTHLVNVAEAKVSVVFKELPGGKIEIGFRAKPGFDVASLAFQLGGGGHTLASGCTLAGSVEEVAARVLPLDAAGRRRRGGRLSESSLAGFLNINKPLHLTSHDVVARLRRRYRELTGGKKVGHAGTLDPLATGVLVICLGAATRLSQYMMRSRKVYQARLQLGLSTNHLRRRRRHSAPARCQPHQARRY